MAPHFDPDDVVAYDTLSEKGRVIEIKLILRDGEVRVFEGDTLTDEVQQWLQELDKGLSKPPAKQINPDAPSKRKPG